MVTSADLRCLGSAEFAVVTVIANVESSNVSALPATNMLGEFSKLLSLNHPHLCRYVDFVRSTTLENAGFVVSEYYPRSVVDELKECKKFNSLRILFLLQPVLSAFAYLHSRHVVVGNFNLNSILLPSEKAVRIAHYGLHGIFGCGKSTGHHICSPWHLPPECFLETEVKNGVISRAGDIWSLGIAVLELSIGCVLSEIWSADQFYLVLKSLIKEKKRGSIFHLLLKEIQRKKPFLHIVTDNIIIIILENALSILPSHRPTSKQLLSIILDDDGCEWDVCKDHFLFDDCTQKSNDITLHESIESMKEKIGKQINMVHNLPINEAFFLWQLCGSSVETILINHSIVKANSFILTLPYLVDGDCCLYGNSSLRNYGITSDMFILPSTNFRDRMSSLEKKVFLTSFEKEDQENEVHDHTFPARRMLILRRLLLSYPFKKSLIFGECHHDIPPLYRANVWSALLSINGDLEKRFLSVDTFSPHASDRQLLVDIPRCHQYDDLMASTAAHRKLKRLLKAWLLLHKNYVYWQGLDSLTAPFLVLNFSRLEYLAVFYHLLAFMDAPLYVHLSRMDFRPELFAIPWFLTCFAHILPLHKLFHVWDALLLSDSSFPLFVGISIMEQLRTRLITSHFNDAILLFSDLPDINMERLVQNSLNYYHDVPSSCTFRQHASKHVREEYIMKHYSLTELSTFCCPRISAVDVRRLTQHSSLLVIDVRPQYEYSRGAIVGSVNLPAYSEDDTLDIIKTALLNAQSVGHVIVIVDNEHLQRAKKISSLCVLEGYNRVCILDGGVQKVRSMHDIFHIPN
ncbi:unnamed protein product [Thelazia callipaeda]|uniref:TBC domain-containing protein kinase-like protein n=1 Tax=Thelazia callipaeda TaxID=103827 RepID=A0A0N5CLS5_THECL|nr:unnamed protein product [Thelazia callipaeda]